MRFNRLKPILLLVLGFAVLGALFYYRDDLKDFTLFSAEKARIHFENFFFAAGSGVVRRMPISTIKTETELQLYIGPPFRDFKPEEWRAFWQLIYGAYPRVPAEKEGLPNKMRQLNREEIAFELAQLYPNPFSYFRPEHWQSFFDIVFGK